MCLKCIEKVKKQNVLDQGQPPEVFYKVGVLTESLF